MKLSKITFSLLGVLLLTGATTTSVLAADTYTVQSNDTLSKIADENDTTVDSIAKLNDIKNIDLILPGQVLKLDKDAKVENTTNATPAVQAAVTTPAPVAAPAASTYVPSVSGDENSAKEWIAQRESHGSYSARNGMFIGRYQLTDAYLHGDYSPANQERVAHNYVYSRYGSWQGAKNFWLSHGWY
ncbi:aggregation-promoting factor [Companilactobacillus sp. DQM5]|uniref:aggregation-promoting factor n=1 Tax=Companilactobacillus sp. DQM5 TaxID=3463359 RepID=UPI004057F040